MIDDKAENKKWSQEVRVAGREEDTVTKMFIMLPGRPDQLSNTHTDWPWQISPVVSALLNTRRQRQENLKDSVAKQPNQINIF